MKAIIENSCGADTEHLLNEMEKLGIAENHVIGCIQHLEAAGIILFSQMDDYIFSPAGSSSPLIRELKKRKPSMPSLEEYELYGWRKLARMI